MYGFIILYLVLICTKMYFDILNGLKYDEYYRTSCEIIAVRQLKESSNCAADLNDMRSDES